MFAVNYFSLFIFGKRNILIVLDLDGISIGGSSFFASMTVMIRDYLFEINKTNSNHFN